MTVLYCTVLYCTVLTWVMALCWRMAPNTASASASSGWYRDSSLTRRTDRSRTVFRILMFVTWDNRSVLVRNAAFNYDGFIFAERIFSGN